MSQGSVFSAHMVDVSVSGAITLVQVKAGAVPLHLLRAWVSQNGSTTSAMQRIGIVRKSSAATVTLFTPLKYSTGSAASLAVGSTSGTGHTATAEGTDTDVLCPDSFNVLSGWLWVPTPEERISVPPSGIIGLKFLSAPSSALTVTAGLVWEESL